MFKNCKSLVIVLIGMSVLTVLLTATRPIIKPVLRIYSGGFGSKSTFRFASFPDVRENAEYTVNDRNSNILTIHFPWQHSTNLSLSIRENTDPLNILTVETGYKIVGVNIFLTLTKHTHAMIEDPSTGLRPVIFPLKIQSIGKETNIVMHFMAKQRIGYFYWFVGLLNIFASFVISFIIVYVWSFFEKRLSAQAGIISTWVKMASRFVVLKKLLLYIESYSLSRAVFILVISLGVPMVFINPPFLVPDEPVHYYRSYQLAQGYFIHVKNSIPNSVYQFSGFVNILAWNTHAKIHPHRILQELDKRHIPGERVKVVETPNLFVPYIPSAIGIVVGNSFGLPHLISFWLARLFNVFAFAILISLAFKFLPTQHLTWLLFLLSPMAIYFAAGVQYDSVSLGICALFLAFVTSKIRAQQIFLPRTLLPLGVLTVLLFLCKPPCFLFTAILVYPLLSTALKKQRMRPLIIPGIVIVCLLGAAAVYYNYIYRNQIIITPQLLDFHWKLLTHTISMQKEFYLDSTIGVFGWLDTYMPLSFYNYFAALFLYFTMWESQDNNQIPTGVVAIITPVIIVAGLAIFLAMYYHWTLPMKFGASIISGVQGRYFIPLLLCGTFLAYHPLRAPIQNITLITVRTLLMVLFFIIASTVFIQQNNIYIFLLCGIAALLTSSRFIAFHRIILILSLILIYFLTFQTIINRFYC